jgi:hypothetical protein
MVKVVEEYVVTLLGVEDKPLPTIWHLQKELFILTKINPKTQEMFNFVKHYEGPYSEVLQESYREPICYEDSVDTNSKGEIILTDQGKKIFQEIKREHSDNPKFSHLLHTLKLIRVIYDKLSKEELLFLMYLTYPEFIEYSNIYDRLVKDEARRKRICNRLLNKGLITFNRYEELVSIGTWQR